jgi:hypothetical protein
MDDQQPQPQPQPQPWRSAVVTSCESGDHDDDDDSSSNENDGHQQLPPASGPDEFYDPHGDEYDEAFVYKHMRGGLPETFQVRSSTSQKNNSGGISSTDDDKSNANTNVNNKLQLSTERLQALKPRHSDAVLQCPCCFETVCMDCQQHERYPDQFRAMFVMNVAVNWDHVLTYDAMSKGLVRTTASPAVAAAAAAATDSSNQIPPESGSSDSNDDKINVDKVFDIQSDAEYYYQTVCANCQTQVAALDMTDEVYHFYGCLASS